MVFGEFSDLGGSWRRMRGQSIFAMHSTLDMHGTFCFMGPVGILANRSLPCLCSNISGDSPSGVASHKRLIYAQSFQWPIACLQVQRELL